MLFNTVKGETKCSNISKAVVTSELLDFKKEVFKSKSSPEVLQMSKPSVFRISDKGFSTPKSKIDSPSFICVLRNFRVCL